MRAFKPKTLLKYKKECRRFLHNSKVSIKPFESIPGPLSLPLFGTLYQYLPVLGCYAFDRLHINGMKKFQKYGPVVREEIVRDVNIVWLFSPEDIEVMFRNEGKHPQRRSHLALQKYRLDRPSVYNTGGLLPTNGPEWLKIRSTFQKGLSSPSAVHNFLKGSDEIVGEWLERITDLREIVEYDYLPELSRLFLELTCFTVFDLRMCSFSEQELQPNSRSSKLMKSALVTNSCVLKLDNGPQIWRKFETPLYRKLRKAQEYMEDVAIDLLSLKMSIFQERDRNNPQSLLDHYFCSPELDFKDIIGMVCDFLLAGVDTSTYSTSFMLYHLANDQEVQCKLYQEAVKLLPYSYSRVSLDVLKQAQYAKAVLKETLRLRPISVGIGRVLDKDAVFSGYNVPAETVVVSQNQVSCRLEEYFPKPNEFIPERWIKHDKQYKQVHPFLVIPFGHGPRSCIARRLAEQNMLVLMLKLIRNYKIRWNGSDIDSQSVLINKPDGPILLEFEKR